LRPGPKFDLGPGFRRVAAGRPPGTRQRYVRVSTVDQNPQLQLDALAAENCLKTYVDRATGTKADRPQWNACLADLVVADR
jgi:hypothetical protein